MITQSFLIMYLLLPSCVWGRDSLHSAWCCAPLQPVFKKGTGAWRAASSGRSALAGDDG